MLFTKKLFRYSSMFSKLELQVKNAKGLRESNTAALNPTILQRVVEAQQLAPNWIMELNGLTREMTFNNFKEAVSFMNQVALLSESINHHPIKLSNNSNIVRISVGQSLKDLYLAHSMEQIAEKVLTNSAVNTLDTSSWEPQSLATRWNLNLEQNMTI